MTEKLDLRQHVVPFYDRLAGKKVCSSDLSDPAALISISYYKPAGSPLERNPGSA